jgi:hypothetical protein
MAEPKLRMGLFSAFTFDDQASCEKAIRNGGIAALISAGLTAVFASIGLFTTSNDPGVRMHLNPWLFVDVGILLVLAYFIFRKSRTAATLTFAYFVFSKATTWYEAGTPKGLFLAIVFFLFYFTAMRATFVWHRRYKTATEAEAVNPAGPSPSA